MDSPLRAILRIVLHLEAKWQLEKRESVRQSEGGIS